MKIKKTRFEISLDESIVILSYLYELSKIKFPVGHLRVYQIVSLPHSRKEIVSVENFYEDTNTGFNISFSRDILVILRWRNAPCFLSFTTFKNDDNNETVYFGFDGEEIDDEPYDEELDGYELYKTILEQALNKSEIHKQIFSFSNIYSSNMIGNLKKVDSQKIFYHDLLLPDFQKDQIEFFSNKILESDHSQRILITGYAGVGKSEVLENIIHNLMGDLLILKLERLNIDFSKLFAFLNIFDNSLLVIDDLDNLTMNSDTRNIFYDLLMLMDSYKNSKIHIAASINENKFKYIKSHLAFKFDSIISINEIEPDYYMSLIKRETDNEEILTSITDSLLEKMKEKMVSGAFIVKFIGQLKDKLNTYAEINEETVDHYFDIIYRSYYNEIIVDD